MSFFCDKVQNTTDWLMSVYKNNGEIA